MEINLVRGVRTVSLSKMDSNTYFCVLILWLKSLLQPIWFTWYSAQILNLLWGALCAVNTCGDSDRLCLRCDGSLVCSLAVCWREFDVSVRMSDETRIWLKEEQIWKQTRRRFQNNMTNSTFTNINYSFNHNKTHQAFWVCCDSTMVQYCMITMVLWWFIKVLLYYGMILRCKKKCMVMSCLMFL